MGRFQSLPPEVIEDVLWYIHSSRDLAALSIQCRLLNRVVDMPQRRRFHCISFDASYRSSEAIGPTFGVLQELLRRPRVRSYVKELRLGWSDDALPICRILDSESYSSTEELPECDERQTDIDAYYGDLEFIISVIKTLKLGGVDAEELCLIIQAGWWWEASHGNIRHPPTTRCPSRFDGLIRTRYPPHGLDSLLAEALAIVLLSITPCLHRLTFSDYIRKLIKAFLLSQTTTGLGPPQGALPMLHEIAVLNPRTADLLDFFKIAGRLPAAQSFQTCRGNRSRRAQDRHVPLPPRFSNIRRIVINNFCISSVELVRLIVHCRSLEEFTFTGVECRNASQIFPESLGKALHCHRQTLCKLDLDIGDAANIRPDLAEDVQFPSSLPDDADDEVGGDFNPPTANPDNERPAGQFLGSLHEFTALTHLSIDIQVLLGWVEGWNIQQNLWDFDLETDDRDLVKLLPPCLEYLHLRGDEEGINYRYTCAIQELKQREELFPNLKTIKGVS